MNDFKPLLAIETSGSLCSASLFFSDEKYFSSVINLKHSHSEKLFGIVDFIFKQAGIERKEISSVAVSIGPGSFTGLRIGLAAAKGIAFAAGVPIIAVPTFEALAYQLSFYEKSDSEVTIANKVNNNEVYYAKFKISPNSYIFTNTLTILPLAKLDTVTGKVYGNAKIENNRGNSNDAISSPSPEYVAKWALIFGTDKAIFDYDSLEPLYIKNFIVKERQDK